MSEAAKRRGTRWVTPTNFPKILRKIYYHLTHTSTWLPSQIHFVNRRWQLDDANNLFHNAFEMLYSLTYCCIWLVQQLLSTCFDWFAVSISDAETYWRSFCDFEMHELKIVCLVLFIFICENLNFFCWTAEQEAFNRGNTWNSCRVQQWIFLRNRTCWFQISSPFLIIPNILNRN